MSISYINLSNSGGSQYGNTSGASMTTPIVGAPPQYDTIGTIINGLIASAPLSSPAFTGNPTAPTPALSSNSNQIATTSYVTSAVTFATGEAVHNLNIIDVDSIATITLDSAPLVTRVHTYTLANGVEYPVSVSAIAAAGSPGGYTGTFVLTQATSSFATGVDATLSQSYKLYMTSPTTLVFEWVDGQEIYDAYWSDRLSFIVPESGTVSTIVSKNYVDGRLTALERSTLEFRRINYIGTKMFIHSLGNQVNYETDLGYLIPADNQIYSVSIVFGHLLTSGAYNIPFELRAQETNTTTQPTVNTGTLITTLTCTNPNGSNLYNRTFTFDNVIDLSTYSGKMLTINTGSLAVAGNVIENCLITVKTMNRG